ncbi:STAS domain-containing protein [Kitasatospora sp. NBC_01250]|uniref:STAS domain-containing protein n=1 Tax=unclassified Kitasatospora TaxID=2633591 RepID=UPI002E11861A|nr:MULTISPECIES: STAS domain-containing protein [unclassified Kitasatospora]WSJ65270.1 STAS domain-containing protein [Kitasatospora sp. NBC_01302]
MPGPNDPITTLLGGTGQETGVTVEIRHPDPTAAVCALAGELDIESLAPAVRALDRLVAQCPRVLVVDLAGVGFCDSSGLNLLLKVRMAAVAAGTDFRLAAPSPTVTRLLELTGADTVFSLHPTVRAALAATAPC